MMLESILDVYFEERLFIRAALICAIAFGAVSVVVYAVLKALEKKHPNSAALMIRRVFQILAASWTALFIIRLCFYIGLHTYLGGYYLMVLDIICVPTFAIVTVITAVKVMLRKKASKIVLALILTLLVVGMVCDTVLFFTARIPQNVFDEIYWSMRDIDYPFSKIKSAQNITISYSDDIFHECAHYTSGKYRVSQAEYHESDGTVACNIYCIEEVGKLLLSGIDDAGNWWLYEYDVGSRELRYSHQSGSDAESNALCLKRILTGWVDGLEKKSKFAVDDFGKYQDIGYCELDDYIYKIVGCFDEVT